ncbi:tyrosinase cofactor [Streptomyces sp. ISL-99]|uniref:apotyrosinase chaperone MelC1 n=1 Tax=Streptomyces sp. ISL-99 TaxID=2819193 RepID=UPI001BE837F9|nr:tyrosinase cofactor [Streptomyces sp. ISL-99]MBT2530201.1 tyrosinase cofactor [Streptomyces sp. ISL-99]
MSQLSRRRALGASATALAGLALTGFARTAEPSGPPAAGHGNGEAHSPEGSGHTPAQPKPFDESFKGRRIQGAPSHHGGHHGAGYSVRIDGEELHVMQNADGTWISVINHYETFTSPRAVARAAVVELQGSQLEPLL